MNATEVHQWGNVQVGDRVTSQGRHGVGQPVVTGVVASINAEGSVAVKDENTKSVRWRSIRNVRKV